MEKHLVGFYRDSGKMTSLYSSSLSFYDTTLKGTITPRIIPLEIKPTNSSWKCPLNPETLPSELADILSSQSIFMTTDKESSPYWIMMYVPTDTPTMSRGGILLRKTNNTFHPVVVKKDNTEYVIDIKGSGCPTGGFPDAHFRSQTGSVSGFHLRVTGGLASPGAKKEYNNLVEIEKTAHKMGLDQHIQALGVNHFKLHFSKQVESFSQLLRLSPSSIRFSFKQNPAFDKLNSSDESIGIYAAGREGAKLLEHKPPLLHRNCSWNNLVYVEKDTYALTDYEEADHAHVSHCNLELINAFYPLYFNNKYYQDNFFDTYKKGLCSVTSKVRSLILETKPTSIASLNEQVMSNIVHPYIYQQRQKEKLNLGFIKDTSNYIHSFLPKSYFQTDLLEWADTKCRFYLTIKKNLLAYYEKIRTKHGFSTLQSLWNQTHKDTMLQQQFEKDINVIEKNIRAYIKHSKMYQQQDLGNYKSEFHLMTLFYAVPTREDWFDQSIQSITTVLTQLNQFIHTKTLTLPETLITDDIEKRRSHLYDNIISIICPYIPFLMVHYYNEKQLLLTINELKTDPVISSSLKQIKKRLALLASNPCETHKNIIENKTALKDLFLLDYM
jgi:hypothetical protein